MRVLFLGTPPFALPALEKLLSSRHAVVGVMTQPDRPRGRSRKPVPPPVKELALRHGLQVEQPDRLDDPSFLRAIQALKADCAVVVAYGRIFPPELLNRFPKGAFNLHASRLPKYRGAAPIQWALIRGEKETGDTLFRLYEQLDHGLVLLQSATPIQP